MNTNSNNNIISEIIGLSDAMTNLYQVDISYNHNLQSGIYSKNYSKIMGSDNRSIVITNDTIDAILKEASYRIPQIAIPSQEAASLDISYKSSSFKKIAPGASISKLLTLPVRIDQSYELYSLMQAACPVDINGIADSYFGDVGQDFPVESLYKESKLPTFEIEITSIRVTRDNQYQKVFAWHFHNCIVTSMDSFNLDYTNSSALSVNIKMTYTHMSTQALDTQQAWMNNWSAADQENKTEQKNQESLDRIQQARQAAIERNKEWSLDQQKAFNQLSFERDSKELGKNFTIKKYMENNSNISQKYFKGFSKDLSLGTPPINIDDTYIKNYLKSEEVKESLKKPPTLKPEVEKNLKVSAANFSGVRSPLHKYNKVFNLGFGTTSNPNLNSDISKYTEKNFGKDQK